MSTLHTILFIIQRSIASIGILIIITGIIIGFVQFAHYLLTVKVSDKHNPINQIRLNLSRILLLGLEFIVAADVVGSITTPDYYSVGILAIIVAIRTVLSLSLNKEIMELSKKN